ncbi:hypothetical protein J7K50_09940 [bacterium]|nr:hypothetical protein [bacterium]
MKRWEYVRIQTDAHKIKSIDDTVDQLGRDGWELAGVIYTQSFVHMWFKRQMR